MGKQSGWIQRQQAQQKAREAEVRHHTRVYTLDMVTLALGRLGWGEKRLREFDQKLTEVSCDYADLIIDDARADKDIVYAKATIDRELAQYVGSMFVPYEERYC